MGRKSRKKKKTRPKPKPFYPLNEVKDLVRSGNVRIRGNALEGAREAFGWSMSDILDALLRLQVKHFYKKDVSKVKPGVVLDFYKAPGLKGENVYMHFYIDDGEGKLIVNSCKEI